MATVTGVVTNLSSRIVTTKYGPKPVFALTVDGTEYDAGFAKKNTAAIGTTVTLDVEMDKYGKMKINNLSMGGSAAASPPSVVASKPTATTSYGRDRPFPIPLTHGDRSIVRQNALTNARELVSSGTLASDGMSDGAIAERIIQLAYAFESYTSGQREQVMAEEATAKLAKVGTIAKESV